MGLINQFQGTTVFLDTAPLIYFIEGHSKYQTTLQELFKANDEGQFTFLTSTITLLEVLVQPKRKNRTDLAEQYKQILIQSPHINILEIDIDISEKAAEIRALYNFKTPDSIQLASAIINGASQFLTNDTKLKQISELSVWTLEDQE